MAGLRTDGDGGRQFDLGFSAGAAGRNLGMNSDMQIQLLALTRPVLADLIRVRQMLGPRSDTTQPRFPVSDLCSRADVQALKTSN